MDMLDQCINYWQNYVSTHRDRLRDHRHTIMVSTITCLVDYKKLKEQINVELPLESGNSPRK